MTDPSLWNTALQLGIGGLSVAGIIYVSLKHSETTKKMQDDFIKALESRADKHEGAMREREGALRAVEKEVRDNIMGSLAKSSTVIADATKLMDRLMRHLDGGR